MKKRILYFFPDNPYAEKAGNRTRFLQLLDYFSSISSEYDTEVLTVGDWGKWEPQHVQEFTSNYPNIKLNIVHQKSASKNKIRKFFEYRIPTAIPKIFKGISVDVTNFILRSKVKKLIRRKPFDIVIASYSRWGRIFDSVGKKTMKIIDTHDFLTAQNRRKKNKIGRFFQSEINILRKFDIIWTYSVEESYIFEQFTDSTVLLLPTSAFSPNIRRSSSTIQAKHVLYVASSNSHNINGSKWLYEQVLPFLDEQIKIHVAGDVCQYIEDHPNIVKHGRVEDISSLYQQAKVVICPMLSGTGVKIKVIEALSLGLPVVTTKRGVDGLVNKVNNGCIVTEHPKDFAENIHRLLHDEHYYEHHRSNAENYYELCHSPSLEKKVLNDIFLNNKYSKG